MRDAVSRARDCERKEVVGLVTRESLVAEDLQRVRQVLQDVGKEDNELLVETIRHLFSRAGKEIRPTLVLLVGQLLTDVGGPLDDHLIDWGATVQIVHTASLVHDDTLDHAATRRGAVTVNAGWSGNVAILVGDYLFAQSAFMAASLGELRAMRLLAETIKDLCRGELLQLSSSFAWDQDETLYYQKIRNKTASLLALCTEGAAVLCHASPEQVAALRAYAVALGMAFQIVDDVLDITGDERTIGKPAGSDLRQGTVTLPVIFYLRDLPPGDPRRAVITGEERVDDALALLGASPALDEARGRARAFVAEAKSYLSGFPASLARQALLELADDAVARTY